MAIDFWSGTGDWNNDPANWSAGVPTSSTDAALSPGSFNSLSTTGSARSLIVLSGARQDVAGGATLTVTAQLGVFGTLNVNDAAGGSTVTIGGALAANGVVNIGATTLAASTSVTAASLVLPASSPGYPNPGRISLTGNTTAASSNQATLKITSAIPTTLAGNLSLEATPTCNSRPLGSRPSPGPAIWSFSAHRRESRSAPTRRTQALAA